jgi:predicted nucleotidyltransferase
MGVCAEKKDRGAKKRSAMDILVHFQPIWGFFGVFKVHVDFSELSVYWGVYIE